MIDDGRDSNTPAVETVGAASDAASGKSQRKAARKSARRQRKAARKSAHRQRKAARKSDRRRRKAARRAARKEQKRLRRQTPLYRLKNSAFLQRRVAGLMRFVFKWAVAVGRERAGRIAGRVARRVGRLSRENSIGA
ncbi:MAG: hypothetical protein GY788_11125, partial [bacterium]|nr:hypothetical protein [bacterium]